MRRISGEIMLPSNGTSPSAFLGWTQRVKWRCYKPPTMWPWHPTSPTLIRNRTFITCSWLRGIWMTILRKRRWSQLNHFRQKGTRRNYQSFQQRSPLKLMEEEALFIQMLKTDYWISWDLPEPMSLFRINYFIITESQTISVTTAPTLLH